MIYDILPVNNYQGNNSSCTFDFDFYIENEEQLEVYLVNKDNMRIKLKNDIDYKINEIKNKNGSYITFPISGSKFTILKDTERISLELSLPICQTVQYNNSSLLNLSTLEYSLDYLTRIVQILGRRIQRAVKVEEGIEKSPDELMNILEDSSSKCFEYSTLASNSLEKVNKANEEIKVMHDEIIAINETIKGKEFLNNDLSNISPNGMKLFDNKLEKNHTNDEMPYVKETYINGKSGYRIYSDGLMDQWSSIVGLVAGQAKTISLLKEFRDTNYIVVANYNAIHKGTGGRYTHGYAINMKTTTTFSVGSDGGECFWLARGYVKEENAHEP